MIDDECLEIYSFEDDWLRLKLAPSPQHNLGSILGYSDSHKAHCQLRQISWFFGVLCINKTCLK
jgi:hypothetical protein